MGYHYVSYFLGLFEKFVGKRLKIFIPSRHEKTSSERCGAYTRFDIGFTLGHRCHSQKSAYDNNNNLLNNSDWPYGQEDSIYLVYLRLYSSHHCVPSGDKINNRMQVVGQIWTCGRLLKKQYLNIVRPLYMRTHACKRRAWCVCVF